MSERDLDRLTNLSAALALDPGNYKMYTDLRNPSPNLKHSIEAIEEEFSDYINKNGGTKGLLRHVYKALAMSALEPVRMAGVVLGGACVRIYGHNMPDNV